MAGRERPIVSILDLKAADVEAIEVELGLSVSSWGNAPSMAQLYRLIFEKATGQSAADLTLRELTDAVALGTETDPNP